MNRQMLFFVALLVMMTTIILTTFSSSTTTFIDAASCTLTYKNTLATSTITLCGRQDGGIPGAWFSKTLAPNETYSSPCVVTTSGKSYETYLTVRNKTSCGWNNGCSPNTGTCIFYPWEIGQGLSSANLYWYGYAAQNFDGGIGMTSFKYSSPVVSYGIKMQCLSYGVTPLNITCQPDSMAVHGAVCQPAQNVLDGFADSGVVACGKNGNANISIEIFETM